MWQTDKANKTNDNLLKLTEQNEKKSVLPFLSINSYITKYEGENIISMFAKAMPESKSNEDANRFVPIENNSKRTDFLLSELNFSISHDQIKCSSELSKEQQEKISSQFGIIKHANGASFTVPDYRYKKVCVENCGKGSAINVKCRLYKIGQEAKDKFDLVTIPFTVPTERHFDIGLYFDLSKDIKGQYTLEITYHDIYSNEYMQSIPLEIFEEEFSIDFYQPQIQLKK